MNCSYKLAESEVVKAMQLHGRGENKTLVTLSIVGISLVLLGAFTAYKAIGFGGTIGSLIGYFTVLYLLIPFNAKKQYKQHRALRNGISITLSEKGINFKSESRESKLQWHDIHTRKTVRHLSVIHYPQPVSYSSLKSTFK